MFKSSNNIRNKLKIFIFIVTFALFLLIFCVNNSVVEVEKIRREDDLSYFKSVEKIDWNDYEQLLADGHRKGFGEHGEAGVLTDPEEIASNEKLFDIFGMSVVVSDKISVNRSVPDFRPKK